jgi:hypothetical protein
VQDKKNSQDMESDPKAGKAGENMAAESASGELADDQLEKVAGGVRAMRWDGF